MTLFKTGARRAGRRLGRLAGASAAVLALTGLALTGLAVSGATAWAAQPEPWGFNLQEPATPVMERLHDFHSLLFIIITGIVVTVLGLLVFVMWRFRASRNPTPSKTAHNTLVEIIWTAVPVLILLVIAWPSFRLLYYMDRVEDPELTVIVTGYQWYWSYELPDQQIGAFNSFMLRDDEIGEEQLRLLSVDRPLVLPVDTNVEILVRAADVLHSWAVPAFGVKTDAVPGRTNHTWVNIFEEGTYYGQCSELCGIGHAYMPIEIQAVSRDAFDDWVMAELSDREPDTAPVLLTRTYEEALERRAALAGATVAADGDAEIPD